MIRVYEPSIADSDIAAVQQALQHGCIGPGAWAERFAAALCSATGMKHCILCNSGTTALWLALKAIGVGPGSNVIAPAYGMHAGAEQAALLGANVWLLDVVMDLWNLDPSKLSGLPIEEFKAVIAIDHNGLLDETDWSGLKSVFDAYNVPLIEDACQALGCEGAFRLGDICTLSFSVPKLVTTGQGGAVLTNNDGYATAIANLNDHGGTWRTTGVSNSLGGNWRMPDVLAALGVSQMERLPQTLAQREAIHDRYNARLQEVPGVDLRLSLGWGVTWRTPTAKLLIEKLKASGIEARQPYKVTSKHRPFTNFIRRYPVAETAEAELVYLPGHVGLTMDTIDKVCDVLCSHEKA